MKQNIENEKAWYKNNPWINRNHFLMKWPFRHTTRHAHAYKYARMNVRKTIQQYLNKCFVNKKFKNILVAPCGTNADQDILYDLTDDFYGIDISYEAIKECPKYVNVKEADILNSGYENDSFDCIASFLFFHHLHKIGFTPFLKEFYRILKKDGVLVLFEPSCFFPFSWLIRLGRKIFGNISGLVPDESPLAPTKLSSFIVNAGFTIERFQSVSFSHNIIPLPLQYILNVVTRPLQKVYPFNATGWMCVWICKKS